MLEHVRTPQSLQSNFLQPDVVSAKGIIFHLTYATVKLSVESFLHIEFFVVAFVETSSISPLSVFFSLKGFQRFSASETSYICAIS